MASGQLNGVTSPDMLHSTITAQLPLQQPQPQAQAKAGCAVPTTADPPTCDRQVLEEKLQILETHKDWADKKIGQLIKRVTEAERPQKDEAYRLRDEVRPLLSGCVDAYFLQGCGVALHLVKSYHTGSCEQLQTTPAEADESKQVLP